MNSLSTLPKSEEVKRGRKNLLALSVITSAILVYIAYGIGFLTWSCLLDIALTTTLSTAISIVSSKQISYSYNFVSKRIKKDVQGGDNSGVKHKIYISIIILVVVSIISAAALLALNSKTYILSTTFISTCFVMIAFRGKQISLSIISFKERIRVFFDMKSMFRNTNHFAHVSIVTVIIFLTKSLLIDIVFTTLFSTTTLLLANQKMVIPSCLGLVTKRIRFISTNIKSMPINCFVVASGVFVCAIIFLFIRNTSTNILYTTTLSTSAAMFSEWLKRSTNISSKIYNNPQASAKNSGTESSHENLPTMRFTPLKITLMSFAKYPSSAKDGSRLSVYSNLKKKLLHAMFAFIGIKSPMSLLSFKGVENDEVVSKTGLILTDVVALTACTVGLASGLSSTNKIIDSLCVFLVLFGPYVSYQKRQLSGFVGHRNQLNSMRESVNNVMEERNHLVKKIDRLKDTNEKLKEIELKLSKLTNTDNIDRLVETIKETKHINSKMEEYIESRITQDIITTIIQVDRNRDLDIGPTEMKRLMIRLHAMPGFNFHDDKFINMIREGDKLKKDDKIPIGNVIEVVRHLRDVNVPKDERIFVLDPKEYLNAKNL